MATAVKQPDYMTLAITNKCNFRCPYCCSAGKGEAQFSSIPNMSFKFIRCIMPIAYSLGVTRFRLSGGEPFVHKDIVNIIQFAGEFPDIRLIVDTNTSYVDKLKVISDRLPRNLEIVCSVDGNNADAIDFHSGRNGYSQRVLENLKFVASTGKLKRVNMVVTQNNILLIPAMIEMCKELGCDLKLADVAFRRNQIMSRDSIYVGMESIKKYLTDNGIAFEPEADYSQRFGTPCDSFRINGIIVKLKDTSKGARYNLDAACRGCKFFPCGEGLYFITVLPDGTFSGCQANGYSRQLPRDVFNRLNEGMCVTEDRRIVEDTIESMHDVIGASTIHISP